ncbi:MAG TPA: hypothetical protein VFJ57_08250 [Solirubrobacterales bacterium]|nr:hypothetical protein [Solirubrobacterales bacterium]
MADVATIAEIGTAVGTLFLGAATFASVRSANRAARVAERSLLLGLRPVLVTARYEDPDAKVLFGDGQKFRVPAGTGLFELIDERVYLAIPLRNVGTGLAVLQGYDVIVGDFAQDAYRAPKPGAFDRQERHYRPIESFRVQQRDIYIAPGDIGYWHAAFRDSGEELHAELKTAHAQRESISIDLLYGDHEGGQHAVSRFVLLPIDDGRWLCNVVFHWTVESHDPRDPG